MRPKPRCGFKIGSGKIGKVFRIFKLEKSQREVTNTFLKYVKVCDQDGAIKKDYRSYAYDRNKVVKI